MRPHTCPSYRHTSELAAEAMISEGGAIRQPSMRETEAVYARLHTPCQHFYATVSEWMKNPTMMFLLGLAAGFTLSQLEKANRRDMRA